MDNLTHSLTAWMLVRSGMDRLSPRAGLVAVLAANLPDADVVAGFGGSHAYLDAHRGITHSIFALPLLALVPVAVAGLIRRPPGFRWFGAWLAALIALISHVLLDWTNIYGIRLLLPFRAEFYRLDIASVIDPWVVALLILGALWPLLARLVTSEIGASRARHGSGLARAVLVLITVYLGARFFLHARAIEILNSRVYEGEAARSVAAMPALANPLEWTGLVELDRSWSIHPVSLRREFDPADGRVFFKAGPSPAIDAASATEPFQALQRFSRTLLWQAVPTPGNEGVTEVTAVDLRFALPGEGRFRARALVDSRGKVLESQYQFGAPGSVPRPR